MRATAASIAAGSAPGPCTMSSSIRPHQYSSADESHAVVLLVSDRSRVNNESEKWQSNHDLVVFPCQSAHLR